MWRCTDQNSWAEEIETLQKNKGMCLSSSFMIRVPSGCKEKLLQTMYSGKMITRQYLSSGLFPLLVCS